MYKFLSVLMFIMLSNFNLRAELDVKATSYIVIDYNSKMVLEIKNPSQIIYPASITKLMTLYIIFDYLNNNKIKLDDVVVISKNAYAKGNYRTGGSTLFLNFNEKVSLEKLILGIIVASGNDSAIAASEYIAGDEYNFVKLMNEYALRLNLKNTNFSNVDGLHEGNHYSTTQDLVWLSYILIKDFPQYYKYFAITEIEHNGVKQPNRNRLLSEQINDNVIIDGLKTGHTDISKYSLSFSAKNDDYRIVGVLSGAVSEKERYAQTKKLIKYIYDTYDNTILIKKDTLLKKIPLLNGSDLYYKLITNNDITMVLPKGYTSKDIEVSVLYYKYMFAPVFNGDQIAKISLKTKDGKYSVNYPVYATYTTLQSSYIMGILKAPFVVIRILINMYL